MSTGLRTIAYTIRLVDAAYFAVPSCVACGRRAPNHAHYCMIYSYGG